MRSIIATWPHGYIVKELMVNNNGTMRQCNHKQTKTCIKF